MWKADKHESLLKKKALQRFLQGPSISKRIEGKGRGETGGRTYGET